jgi:2-aminoethylphosphonate-pyruvate transaminase
MLSETQDPWLLTPGPLTTSLSIKQAMLHDWGSRDAAFIDMTARVRNRLIELLGADDDYVCVPLQGSGTFVVEAAISTMLPRDGKLLVLINGAYGHRMVKICDYLGRASVTLETAEDVPSDVAALDALLQSDPSITHVAAVHCETTSGILNPISEIAACVKKHDRSLLIDSMSAFGALPLDAATVPFDAVVASSNKCIEGVPGIGFAVFRKSALGQCKGNCHSLSLDLYDQWQVLEGNGQWRFTPPTHVLAAFDQALREHEEEGGVDGRGGRYSKNCRALIDGMKKMGFAPLLSDNLQAPIIVTFHMPADPAFDFEDFYRRVGEKGFLLYPGKLTVAPTFRIGCIGRLGLEQINAALDAIQDVIKTMGVTELGPQSG